MPRNVPPSVGTNARQVVSSAVKKISVGPESALCSSERSCFAEWLSLDGVDIQVVLYLTEADLASVVYHDFTTRRKYCTMYSNEREDNL